MEALSTLIPGLAIGGIRIYLTLFSLGVSQSLGFYSLPEKIQFLANPFVLVLFGILALAELIAEFFPVVEHIWHLVHSFISPVAAAILGYLVAPETPTSQIILAATAGGVTMATHMGKAGTRAIASTHTPIIGNVVLNLAENTLVIFMIVMIVHHPYIALIISLGLILLAIVIIYTAYKIVGGLLSWIFG